MGLLDMPERTAMTLGRFQQKRYAHSAGVDPGFASSKMPAMSSGSLHKTPPRAGSMMMTGLPWAAATSINRFASNFGSSQSR